MQGKASIFRKEAVEHHQEGSRGQGDVLQIAPWWSAWAYWLLVAGFVAGLLFCALGSVNEYASGPALVRVETRTQLPVPAAGLVATVEVELGQQVATGQTLVTFADDAQGARLVAPFDGVVSEVHLHPGQRVRPEMEALSLTRDSAPVMLQVFLPGEYRPLLREGMPLRFELEGFRGDYRELPIEFVSNQIVGPDELRRSLGTGTLEALRVKGSSVFMVRVRLSSSVFEHEGQTLQYFDGMLGQAMVRVRTERVLTLLIPGLRGLPIHGE